MIPMEIEPKKEIDTCYVQLIEIDYMGIYRRKSISNFFHTPKNRTAHNSSEIALRCSQGPLYYQLIDACVFSALS